MGPKSLDGKLWLDEVLATERLADAADVATAIRGRLAVRQQETVALLPHGRTTLELRPRPDLTPFDQIVVTVRSEQGHGAVHVIIHCLTTSSGGTGPDRFHSGPATQLDQGRQWCFFPFENFLIHGMPAGWTQIDRIELLFENPGQEGDLAAVEVELQQRRRVIGPRLTDEGLLEELDLDRPELAAVREARQKGVANALDQVCRHFRHRQPLAYPLEREFGLRDTCDLALANRALEHHVEGQQFDPVHFDWRWNAIGYLEWMHRLNRQFFFLHLLQAYHQTGDEQYAWKLDYLIDTWMDQNPEPVAHNGGGDPAWETLSAGCRTRFSLAGLWQLLQHSPSLRPATRIKLLKTMWAHANHLQRHQGYGNNWVVVESLALVIVGYLIPEFRRSEEWLREGLDRLQQLMAEQVYADGAQFEISPGYHVLCGKSFALAYELARCDARCTDQLDDYRHQLEGMFDYIAYTARPDGTHPALNDSGGVGGGYSDWLAQGWEIFGHPHYPWVASRGAQGTAPAATSHSFPDAGIFVFRSDWGQDARYLIFDAGPYGAAHQHEDKLSFELCWGNDYLIVDPGIASYLPDAWTAYSRHTRAHNTIMIDGGGQQRRTAETREQHIRSVRDEVKWDCGQNLRLAYGSYDAGYEGVEGTFRHERAVVHVRPDYFVIFDRITGQGRHLVEALFHFMPVRLELDGNRVRTNRTELRNVEIVPLDPASIFTPTVVTGAMDPVQGWVADRENKPAPCAIFRAETELPVEVGWVLAPYQTGRSAGLQVTRVDDGTWLLSWATGEVDTLHWDWQTLAIRRE